MLGEGRVGPEEKGEYEGCQGSKAPAQDNDEDCGPEARAGSMDWPRISLAEASGRAPSDTK